MDPALPEGFVPEVSRNDNRSTAHGIQINNIGRTSIILITAFGAVALGIAIMVAVMTARDSDALIAQMKQNETETRMTEYYIMELDGKLMQSGMIDFKQSYSYRKQQRAKDVEKSK